MGKVGLACITVGEKVQIGELLINSLSGSPVVIHCYEQL